MSCSVKNDKGFASVDKVLGSPTAREEHKFTGCKTSHTWDTGLETLDKCILCLSVCPLWGMCPIWRNLLPVSRSWVRLSLSERQASLFHFSISRHIGEAIRAAATQENAEPQPYLTLWVTFPPMSVRKPWPYLSLRDSPCSEWSLWWFWSPTSLSWQFPAKTNNYISMAIKSLLLFFLLQKGLLMKWKKFLMTRRHRTKVDKRAIPRMTWAFLRQHIDNKVTPKIYL